jgi:DMSO/TMAO reductase YedYZ molybdopterin-dependent catalytic subunit
VRDFPVLDLGVHPDVSLQQWTLNIRGLVENPVCLNWSEFLELPRVKDSSDLHCVTTWSQFDMAWEGVSFFTLTDLVKPKLQASYVHFKSYDGYTTNNTMAIDKQEARD